MPTSEVYTALPVTKATMNIQIKELEPKQFNGEKQDTKSWLKQIKGYFTSAGLQERDDMHNTWMNAIAQALMRGKISKCLDRLE